LPNGEEVWSTDRDEILNVVAEFHDNCSLHEIIIMKIGTNKEDLIEVKDKLKLMGVDGSYIRLRY